jgi:hypothetical protein
MMYPVQAPRVSLPDTVYQDASNHVSFGGSFESNATGSFSWRVTYADGSSDEGTTTYSNTLPPIMHTYSVSGNRRIVLRIRDAAGRYGYDTAYVKRTHAPVASLDGPWSGNEGSPIAMSAAGSTDADGDALTYKWIFGDGTFGTGALVNHRFPDDGDYAITVIVRDARGGADTVSAVATVANARPYATFTAPATATVNGTFGISFASPGDPGSADRAAGFTYAFDCGSGMSAFSSSTTATCASRTTAGNQTVRGEVRDKDGGLHTYNRRITVQ